jgi:Zn-dependent protease with chaperone function
MAASKIYYSVGLNEQLPNKRTAGEITLSKSSLSFQCENETIVMNFKRINARIGGSGNSLVFFTHPDYPEWDIYTSDKSILRDPAIKNDPAFSDIRSEGIKTAFKTGLFVLSIAFVITSLIFLFKEFKEYMTFALAAQVPISLEKKLGDAAFKSVTLGKKIYDDPKVLQLLEPITNRLTEATKQSGYHFKFYVIEDSDVNALAFPGGNILIHSALIQKADTPEEIAGVLAHEISHITHKHGLRQIINSVGVFIIVQALFGDFSGLVAIFTQNSGLLLSSSFSREYEREADASGFDYLVKTKTDPKGMVRFFERIMEIKKEADIPEGTVINFISTHPGTEERIESFNKKYEKINLTDFIPIQMELKKLQKFLE